MLLVKQCLELQVFSILQFGEANQRELATTEFLTTATIAITVLSDHGSGGWRKASQVGAELDASGRLAPSIDEVDAAKRRLTTLVHDAQFPCKSRRLRVGDDLRRFERCA